MKPGITYKGLSSRSLGLTMRTVSWPVLPNMTRSTVNVPKRPGSVDFEIDTMLESQATVIFSWLGATPQDVISKGGIVSGWLNNNGTYHELKNNAIPDRKYYAKVTEAVPLTVDPCTGMVQVTFTFNPPYPFRLDNSPASPEDEETRLLWDTAVLVGNQYIQTFTAPGFMRFTLSGTGEVLPVIKLYGRVPAGFKLARGAQEWQYNAILPYDGIKIDCGAEAVTRISDGANLFTNTGPADYFTLSPGQLQIDITGSVGPFPDNVTVAVEAAPNYGG